MTQDHVDGFLRACETLMMWLNSLDTEGMTPDDIRSAVYAKCMDLRP